MPPHRSGATPPRPVTIHHLRAAGWSDASVSRAVRAGELVRVLPQTYVPATLLATDRFGAAIDAARCRHGDEAIAVLGSAARLHGLPDPWPPDPAVHIALPPGRERVQRPGYRIHTWILTDDEITTVGGRRVTSLERTLADLMCLSDRYSAVSALDAALHAGRLTGADVLRLRATTVRRRGAARSREWWTEADARAESPLETRVRLRAVDGGYRPDQLQKVFDIEFGTARVDLVWKLPGDRWLCVEADGTSWHDTPDALFRDRRRSNALVARGDVVPVRTVWADTERPATVPRILARHLGPPRL